MLIPIKTERPPRRATVVTHWLIGLCVVIFLLQSAVGRFAAPGEVTIIDRCLLQFPIEFVDVPAADQQAVLDRSPDLVEALNPGGGFAPWQPITYQFLHGGILHLLFNMLFLWVFGPPVEDRLGRVGFLAFYLAAGIAAAAAHALFAPEILPTSFGEVRITPAVLGASGSIAGVTGAFLILFPKVRVRCLLFFFIIGFFDIPAWVLIVFAVAKDLLFAGGGGGVAYEAHLGGYAFGAAVVGALLAAGVLKREPMYDLVSLYRHASRRRAYRALAHRHGVGDIRRTSVGRSEGRTETTDPPDPAEGARRSIIAHVRGDRAAAAADAYLDAAGEHGPLWLGRDPHLSVARALAEQGRHADAAAAYELFLERLPHDREADEIRILLALISARRLNDPVRASALLDQVDEAALPDSAATVAQSLRRELA